jgi:uncharacterized membrane protein (UPF0136 family)
MDDNNNTQNEDTDVSTVRAYDTKAQIVGIGYIFALGIVFQFANKLDPNASQSTDQVILAWTFIIVPIILFGAVLYPTRKIVPSLRSTQFEDHGYYYVLPGQHKTAADYPRNLRQSNLVEELSSEVLKIAELRDLKRRRFLRALWAAMISFLALFVSQLIRSMGGTVL